MAADCVPGPVAVAVETVASGDAVEMAASMAAAAAVAPAVDFLAAAAQLVPAVAADCVGVAGAGLSNVL